MQPPVCGIQETAYIGKMAQSRRKCLVNARKLAESKRYILQSCSSNRRKAANQALHLRVKRIAAYWLSFPNSPTNSTVLRDLAAFSASTSFVLPLRSKAGQRISVRVDCLRSCHEKDDNGQQPSARAAEVYHPHLSHVRKSLGDNAPNTTASGNMERISRETRGIAVVPSSVAGILRNDA